MSARILLLCHDTIGKKLAGPGIRYKNVQRVLGAKFTVTLGLLVESLDDYSRNGNTVPIITSGDQYKKAFDEADYIFTQWLSDEMIAYAKSKGIRLIFDFYAPIPVEFLASKYFSNESLSGEDIQVFNAVTNNCVSFLLNGDVFLCSNERQKDFWLGYLFSVIGARVNDKSTIESLLLDQKFLLCPMGIDASKPVIKTHSLRNIEGIDKDDFVLLWTGGIWDWFDTVNILRAVKSLQSKDESVKLVFMGMQHPNSKIPEMRESKRTRALAKELDLVGKSVFFLEGWVDYSDRANYLLDADAAIYSDKSSVESRFSHRTRILDHIWATLPTICSRGDYLSGYIEANSLGITFDRDNPDSIEDSILKLKSDTRIREQIKNSITTSMRDLSWEKTLEPLVDYIDATKDLARQKKDPVSVAPNTIAHKPAYGRRVARKIKRTLKRY